MYCSKCDSFSCKHAEPFLEDPVIDYISPTDLFYYKESLFGKDSNLEKFDKISEIQSKAIKISKKSIPKPPCRFCGGSGSVPDPNMGLWRCPYC